MGAKNKKFLDIIRTVAPTIASALGGPLAGTAIGAISNAIFGKPDATVEEIEEKVLSASPETLLALKTEENSFKLEIKKLELDETKLSYDDTDSARRRHTEIRDKEPARLAYLAMVVFAVMVAVVLTQTAMIEASEFAKVIVSTMIGASISWVNSGYNFFLGSSVGSKNKSDDLAEQVRRSLK